MMAEMRLLVNCARAFQIMCFVVNALSIFIPISALVGQPFLSRIPIGELLLPNIRSEASSSLDLAVVTLNEPDSNS